MSFSYFNRPADLHDGCYTKDASECDDDSKLILAITRFCWCPGVFLWNHRLQENFLYADWIGLDFDSGPTLAEMTKTFSDMECIIGTTKNHQKWKKDEPPCDRFRVVLRLEHRCNDFRDYKATLADLIKEYDSDAAASDSSRFFRPCREVTYNTVGQAELYTQEIIEAPPYTPPVVTRPSSGAFYKTPLYRSVESGAVVSKRNETLFLIGIDLRRQGLSESEIWHEIDRLIPTIENSSDKKMNFPEKEKRSILSSIMRQKI